MIAACRNHKGTSITGLVKQVNSMPWGCGALWRFPHGICILRWFFWVEYPIEMNMYEYLWHIPIDISHIRIICPMIDIYIYIPSCTHIIFLYIYTTINFIWNLDLFSTTYPHWYVLLICPRSHDLYIYINIQSCTHIIFLYLYNYQFHLKSRLQLSGDCQKRLEALSQQRLWEPSLRPGLWRDRATGANIWWGGFSPEHRWKI